MLILKAFALFTSIMLLIFGMFALMAFAPLVAVFLMFSILAALTTVMILICLGDV